MALNATTLGATIATALKPGYLACGALDNAALTAFLAAQGDAIATAVVAHIQAAGVVTVVTTCPAGAGSGTGTVG